MKVVEYEETKEIIDRDDETDYINNSLIGASKSQVFIIQANSGLGKTSLTKKLMAEKKIDGYDYFRVKTAPHNKNDNSTEWLFIDEIFDSIRTYYDQFLYNDFLKFKNYLSYNNNKLIQSLANNELISGLSISDDINGIKTLGSFVFSTFKSSFKRFSNLGYYNPYATIYDNSALSRSIKTEYIRYVLSNTKCILIVENAQNIDYISLKYLLDWINDTKNYKHGFILEYTTSDDDSVSYLKELTHSLIATNVNIKRIELGIIDKKYVLQIIDINVRNKPTDISFSIDALEHFDNYSNGNIWDLLDYARTYETSKKEKRKNEKPTLEKFLRLSDKAQIVSYIIFYYSGIVNKKKLVYIYESFFSSKEEGDIKGVLEELHESNIIESENTEAIVFAHASITDVVSESIKLNTNIYLSIYHSLIAIFENSYNGKDVFENKAFAWHMLLKLYVDNEPDKIAYLLDDFLENIMNTISSKNAWAYIKAFIISTKHKIPELIGLYFKVLEVCYKTLLYEEGLWCITQMEKQIDIYKNDQLLLHKMLYLSILDKQDDVINIYNKIIDKVEKYTHKWINLKLIVLNCYISINRKDLCIEIHNELITIPKLKKYAEYPYFLRLTNIYLPYNKSLRNAKKSIKLFAKIGDIEQEGKSWITYSKLLSSIGKHKKAIKAIKNAQSKLSSSHVGYACIYNNLAGYLMLKNEHGPEIWNYLDIAEQYSVTIYDKLSVVLNKLAWCYENKAFNRIDLLENKAKAYIEKEPSKLIHCTTYYNLYLIMVQSNNQTKAKKYYKKFYELKDYCPYIKARIDGINSENKYLKHRIKKPYHICYLSFWVYDLKWDESYENKHSS